MMRALWLAPLLLCFILSSVNANLCSPGCKTCDYLIKCTACEKGYVLNGIECGKCADGCDKCEVSKTEGSKYWTHCTGSCQTACTECNSDYTCAKCSVGYSLLEGQCRSCQGDCDKCYFTPTEDNTGNYIMCTGSCKGGCDACSNGDTCTRCQSGYVLNNGVCYACNDCSECNFVQVSSISYRTECVATPTPNSDSDSGNSGNNDNNGNSGNSGNPGNNQSDINPMIFIIAGCVLVVGGIFFFIIKNKGKQNDFAQQ